MPCADRTHCHLDAAEFDPDRRGGPPLGAPQAWAASSSSRIDVNLAGGARSGVRHRGRLLRAGHPSGRPVRTRMPPTKTWTRCAGGARGDGRPSLRRHPGEIGLDFFVKEISKAPSASGRSASRRAAGHCRRVRPAGAASRAPLADVLLEYLRRKPEYRRHRPMRFNGSARQRRPPSSNAASRWGWAGPCSTRASADTPPRGGCRSGAPGAGDRRARHPARSGCTRPDRRNAPFERCASPPSWPDARGGGGGYRASHHRLTRGGYCRGWRRLRPASIELDVDLADDLGPLGQLGMHEAAQLGWRAGLGRGALALPNRLASSGEAIASSRAAFSFSMIWGGVPLGAIRCVPGVDHRSRRIRASRPR